MLCGRKGCAERRVDSRTLAIRVTPRESKRLPQKGTSHEPFLVSHGPDPWVPALYRLRQPARHVPIQRLHSGLFVQTSRECFSTDYAFSVSPIFRAAFAIPGRPPATGQVHDISPISIFRGADPLHLCRHPWYAGLLMRLAMPVRLRSRSAFLPCRTQTGRILPHNRGAR